MSRRDNRSRCDDLKEIAEVVLGWSIPDWQQDKEGQFKQVATFDS